MSLYSEYQYFLYETISELRDKEMIFEQIAEQFNKKKIEKQLEVKSLGVLMFIQY